MKVLVISAHPDDEVIGAGGTILRHIDNGDDVYWCVVTEPYSPPWLEDEVAEAIQQVTTVQEFLGIKEVFRLHFPTVKLNTVPYIDLTSALQRVVNEVQPEIVYTTPVGDINLDHHIVFEATAVTTRSLPGSSVRRLLCYEISTTTRFSINGFDANVYIDISDYFEKKLEAIALYKTELRTFPHPRSIEGLRILSQERGLAIGVNAAEAFRLIQEILR